MLNTREMMQILSTIGSTISKMSPEIRQTSSSFTSQGNHTRSRVPTPIHHLFSKEFPAMGHRGPGPRFFPWRALLFAPGLRVAFSGPQRAAAERWVAAAEAGVPRVQGWWRFRWGFPCKWGVPQKWMVYFMENPWKSQSQMDDDWGYPHFRKPPDGKFNVYSSEIHSMSINKMVWCSRDGESTMAIENPISYFCFKAGTIKTINCCFFFHFHVWYWSTVAGI